MLFFSSAGGLVTAVAPIVIRCKGKWIGWTGNCSLNAEDDIPEASPNDNSPTAGLRKSQVIPVHLDQRQFGSYYNGFCNGTLWPIFHSMSDRAVYSTDYWKVRHYLICINDVRVTRLNELLQDYIQVNQLFAAKTLESIQPSDDGKIPLVWIHDYHLMLMPSILRQAMSNESNIRKALLGFFLHIPFPPWDIFRLLPWDKEILLGLLG